MEDFLKRQRAKGKGQKAKGKGHGAWGMGHRAIAARHLPAASFMVICCASLVIGHWLRVIGLRRHSWSFACGVIGHGG
jgi:hypothetical protein